VKCLPYFSKQIRREEYLEDLGVDVRIILKWNLKKWGEITVKSLAAEYKANKSLNTCTTINACSIMLVALVRGDPGPIRIEIKFVLQLVGIEHVVNTEFNGNSKSKHKV
jgi:hypothetical protein